MIWRKLPMLGYEQNTMAIDEKVSFKMPYWDEIKHTTIRGIRKYGYYLLVIIVRLYVQSTSFLKEKYREIKQKIKEMVHKKHENGERKEISKFLKVIGDYKNKIREITHKIKKEENL